MRYTFAIVVCLILTDLARTQEIIEVVPAPVPAVTSPVQTVTPNIVPYEPVPFSHRYHYGVGPSWLNPDPRISWSLYYQDKLERAAKFGYAPPVIPDPNTMYGNTRVSVGVGVGVGVWGGNGWLRRR